MSKVIENVKVLNSTVRTTLLVGCMAVVGWGGFFVYSEYTKRERIMKEQAEKILAAESKVAELNKEIEEKNALIEKLETARRLLKTDQRLAQLRVKSIERNEAGEATTSKLEFVELSPQGDPLSEPKQIELPGDVIYIDNWIVKFDDNYVERGDIERGTSLCLFRRIFSEQLLPNKGITLDEVGMRPQAYARGSVLTDFEKKLWSEFWEFANDPKKASEMGIRAANGEAVSIKVRDGVSYNISLRASGGLSLEPIEQK